MRRILLALLMLPSVAHAELPWDYAVDRVAPSAGGSSSTSLAITGKSQLQSSADGYFEMYNAAGTGFTALRWGGTSASVPMLKSTGTTLAARLADDSADAPFTVGALTAIPAGGVTGLTISKDVGAFPICGIGIAPVTVTALTVRGQTSNNATYVADFRNLAGSSVLRLRSDGQILSNVGIGFVTGYNGSAGAPPFSVNGEGGLYSPGSGQIGLSAGGTAAITFDASRNATVTGTVRVQSAGIIRSGSAATPNGSVTGNVGDIYLSTNGGAATTLWIKESGAATNTGWVGK